MAGNLTDLLSRQAGEQPEAPAVHMEGRLLSFRDLELLVWRTATVLHGEGVRRGDVVALTLANELAGLVAMLAVARLGATVFSLPVIYPAALRAGLLARTGARFVVSDQRVGHVEGTPLLLLDLNIIQNTSPDTGVRDPRPEAPWLLIQGSGSTGVPKLMPLRHDIFLHRVALFDRAIPLTRDDRVATLTGIDFQVAKIQYLHALFRGASIVVPALVGGTVEEICRTRGVTVLYAAVVHVEGELRERPASDEPALGFLRALVIGGSTVSDSLRGRAAKGLCGNLYIRYGTNETGPLADASPPGVFSVPGSVGRPYGGVELVVTDPDGAPLPAGETGLVKVRTPGLIDGYLNDSEASRGTFSGGWFTTGDLGMMTPEGELVFRGRADDLMIFNGINIYPAEIESLFLDHGAVADVAVMAAKSGVHQDVPVCLVSLREGCGSSEEALLSYAEAHLGFMAPRKVVLVERIPRNDFGKLARADAARLVAAKLGLKLAK